MITDRDKRVIVAIGEHKILSHQQIQKLEFSTKAGYYNLQRRMRKEYLNGYLQRWYIDVDSKGNKLALFKLDTKGKNLYKELTGNNYKIPRWNLHYVPHLIETNQVLIDIKESIRKFDLEYSIGSVKMDALIQTKRGKKVALEVDLSESEPKKEIIRQFQAYEDLYYHHRIPDILVWYSNRYERLDKWMEEKSTTNLKILFLPRTKEKRNRLKNKLNLL
ncbi:MAG: replication-relaxation family protein [Halanaerobiales bacterium]